MIYKLLECVSCGNPQRVEDYIQYVMCSNCVKKDDAEQIWEDLGFE